MEKKELLEKLKEEQLEKNYTLIINKNASNKEFMVLKKEHLIGAQKYYPQKEFVEILKNDNIKNILDKLIELKLTEYDVVFIDNLDFEIFYLVEHYLLTFTQLRSIVIDSRCRIKEEKAVNRILEKIKNEIDNCDNTYNISLFDELVLEKRVIDIEEYAKEKNKTVVNN